MKNGSQNWQKRVQQNKQATTKNKHKHAKQQRRKNVNSMQKQIE